MSLLAGRNPLTSRPPMVAIDVDGTLIRSDWSLSDATADAVADARAAGIVVVLASSRPLGGLGFYRERLGLIEPAALVALQGSLVATFDPAGTRTLHAAAPMDAGDAAAAAIAAHSMGVVTNWYATDHWYVNALTQPVRREAAIVKMEPIFVTDLSTLPPPLKLLFIAERQDQLQELIRLLPSSLEAEVSHSTYLEVTAAGVDKAAGVRVAAGRSGIGVEEVVAIGDGRNDLGLFRAARSSVAPANADDRVLAEADYITASNDDDGVAIALRWLAALPRPD